VAGDPVDERFDIEEARGLLQRRAIGKASEKCTWRAVSRRNKPSSENK